MVKRFHLFAYRHNHNSHGMSAYMDSFTTLQKAKDYCKDKLNFLSMEIAESQTDGSLKPLVWYNDREAKWKRIYSE